MTFKAGKSGNPRGAPKGRLTKQIAELLRKDVDAAVEVLRRCLHNPDKDLEAAKEILNRVYGKPAQSVEVSGEGGGPLIAVIRDTAKANYEK